MIVTVLDGQVTVTMSEETKPPEPGEGESAGISVDGDNVDWGGTEPVIIDDIGDAPSLDEDLKALLITNDTEYLYFMVAFCTETPRSVCELRIDTDFNGGVDFIISVKYEEVIDLFNVDMNKSTIIGEKSVALNKVIEGRVPLAEIGNPQKVGVIRVDIVTMSDEGTYISDTWEGILEVELKEYTSPASDPVTAPSLSQIHFPYTESLWKTTDGGTAWERILTSGMKLLVDGEEVQVGTLESIGLSDNFANDNTLFIYEGGDKPRVWMSTNGGNTFTIHQ